MSVINLLGMDTYKMMYKPSRSAIYIVAALFDQHVNELPRFQNAWIESNEGEIRLVVLARIGAKYHGKGEVFGQSVDETVYMHHKNFDCFRDGYNGFYDGKTFYDNTFGRYYFHVPSEYEKDFYLLLAGKKYDQLSEVYKKRVSKLYPSLLPLMKFFSVKIETEEEVHRNTIDLTDLLK